MVPPGPSAGPDPCCVADGSEDALGIPIVGGAQAGVGHRVRDAAGKIEVVGKNTEKEDMSTVEIRTHCFNGPIALKPMIPEGPNINEAGPQTGKGAQSTIDVSKLTWPCRSEALPR